MVVSDGMGGAAAGEVASDFAVKTLFETLAHPPDALPIAEALKQAAEAANERIWNHAQDNPALLGMGATLTAVWAQHREVHIAQVGDSRAYLVRGDKIAQLTKDQSLAQALVDAGIIEPEQAHLVPQNVIKQALGTQPSLDVKMTRLEICRNDAILICSDGLSNKIEAPEMMQIVKEAGDVKAAAKRIIYIANERGG
jgi:protein phosphatase